MRADISQGPHIANLHEQIQVASVPLRATLAGGRASPVALRPCRCPPQMCDQILESMETLLTGFQEDLGSISAEIQTLQTQSLSMNVKLRNRKVRRRRVASPWLRADDCARARSRCKPS